MNFREKNFCNGEKKNAKFMGNLYKIEYNQN